MFINRPLCFHFVQSVHVFRRCGVHKGHVLELLVETLDQSVGGVEVHMSVCVLEIASLGNHDVVCFVLIGQVGDYLVQHCVLVGSVVSLGFGVCHYRIIYSRLVNVETGRSEISIVHDMREDLLILIRIRPPQKLQLFLILSIGLILVIKPPEEPRIKPKITEKPGIEVRVAKGIDLPADGGRVAVELLSQKVVALLHVVEHVFVVRAGLVVHRPPAVYEL